MTAPPNADTAPRRSPSGERGLKFVAVWQDVCLSQSLPIRGAWIEIDGALVSCEQVVQVAPHPGSVD